MSEINDPPGDRPGHRADAAFAHYLATRAVSDLQSALLICAPALLRTAKYLGGGSHSEDLVQETFVVAISRMDSFREGEPLFPWLAGILRNLARSRRWRRWTQNRVPVEVLATEPDLSVDDPSAVVERAEWVSLVARHSRSLPEPHRLVVERHLFDGEALVDIAASLGRPASTVRTHLERGLRKLRSRLPAPLLAGLAAMLAPGTSRAQPRATLPSSRWQAVGIAVTLVAVLAFVRSFADVGGAGSLSFASPGPGSGPAVADSRSMGSEASAQSPTGSVRESLPSRAIRVRLKTSDGLPAAGVPLILDSAFARGMPVVRSRLAWRNAITDHRGEAEFIDLSPSRVGLRTDGLSLLLDCDPDSESRTREFVVSIRGQMVVRVIDGGGAPVSGATVVVGDVGLARAPGHPAAYTDADGNARIVSTLPRACFWVEAPGFEPSTSYLWQRPALPRDLPAVVRLERATARWRGRVSNLHGEPVGGAMVAIWSVDGARLPPRFVAANRQGEFDIEGRAIGGWRASACGADTAVASVALTAANQAAELRLMPGGRVQGRVLALAKHRAARLRVIARPLAGWEDDPLEQSACTVAEDGTFGIANLRPADYELALFDGGSRPTAVRRAIVREGERTEVWFEPLAERIWDLVVVDERDQPIPGCRVRTRSEVPRIGFRYEQTATTGDDGRVRLSCGNSQPETLLVHVPHQGTVLALPSIAVAGATPAALTKLTVPDVARDLPPLWWTPTRSA